MRQRLNDIAGAGETYFRSLPQNMLGYLLSRGSIQCLAKLPNPWTNMNTAYFSAFAALTGSVIGGLTTFAAAWITDVLQLCSRAKGRCGWSEI